MSDVSCPSGGQQHTHLEEFVEDRGAEAEGRSCGSETLTLAVARFATFAWLLFPLCLPDQSKAYKTAGCGHQATLSAGSGLHFVFVPLRGHITYGWCCWRRKSLSLPDNARSRAEAPSSVRQIQTSHHNRAAACKQCSLSIDPSPDVQHRPHHRRY
jgi:hypothetical protein